MTSVKLFKKVPMILSCVIGGAVVIIVLFFAAIDRVFDYAGSRDEVARVTSPSGLHEAVMFETNGGATTSFGYEIYIVRSGTKQIVYVRGGETAYLYGATRNTSAYGANLRWQDDRTLVVEYLTANRVRLDHPTTAIEGAAITVELKPGIIDPTAPPGGMLHNRRPRPPS